MGILALTHMIVLVVLGLAALGVGIAVALRPAEHRLGLLRPLSLATAFAALSAICSGVAVALTQLAESAAAAESAAHLWAGLAEAMVPGIFGFGVLALAWGLATIGLRRQP